MIKRNNWIYAEILIFRCRVEYKRIRQARLALDTGASLVALSRDILEGIGFSLDTVTDYESFGNASQSHTVRKVTLTALSIDNARLEDVEALCYTLPASYGIDCVIGFNFLRRFRKVLLDFERGLLVLEA